MISEDSQSMMLMMEGSDMDSEYKASLTARQIINPSFQSTRLRQASIGSSSIFTRPPTSRKPTPAYPRRKFLE